MRRTAQVHLAHHLLLLVGSAASGFHLGSRPAGGRGRAVAAAQVGRWKTCRPTGPEIWAI
jgi:hypothetical protein